MDEDAREPTLYSGMVLLHREIVKHGEVVLQKADFDAYEADRSAGQVLRFKLGPNEAIILTHDNPVVGEEVH